MFKFIHEDEDFKVTLEVGDSAITHDKVAEYFTNFLRGCGFVFDHLATHRLVNDEGDVLPSFEERLRSTIEKAKEKDAFYQKAFTEYLNEEDRSTFPVI
jgi:hypothetical protein